MHEYTEYQEEIRPRLFNEESWKTDALNEVRIKSAGKQTCELYAKLAAHREAMPAETIDWAHYIYLCQIGTELAGIIGTLGFTLEGEQK